MNIKFLKKKALAAERQPDPFSVLITQLVNKTFPNVSPDDRSALIKAGSGFAYAITNKIANNCAMVPIRLMVKGKTSGMKTIGIDKRTKDFIMSPRSGFAFKSVDDIQEVYESPIIDLLDDMNDYDDGVDVNCNTELQLLQMGTAFWMVDRGDSQALDPQRIHLLEGDQVTPIFDKQKFRTINGYKYQDQELTTDEVIRFRYSNAYDWFWGKSPLSAAIEFFNTSTNLASLLKELSKNKNGMDLYLANKGENVQPLQGDPLANLKKQFSDYRHGNIRADEIMYLGNMELAAIPNMNKDLPFIDNLNGLFKMMCWVFGMSDSVFTKESSNRADKKEALRDYYESVIQPKLVRKQARLNRYLIPMFKGAVEKGLFLLYEDSVPVDVEQLINEVKGGIATPNEAREIRKRDAMDGGEYLYMPSTSVPVGMDIDAQGKALADAVKKEFEKE